MRLASQRVFDSTSIHLLAELCGRHYQVGSLPGAAHLLNDNANVLLTKGDLDENRNLMWTNRGIQTVKTWPIDPLGLRNVQLEVSRKLPQG